MQVSSFKDGDHSTETGKASYRESVRRKRRPEDILEYNYIEGRAVSDVNEKPELVVVVAESKEHRVE